MSLDKTDMNDLARVAGLDAVRTTIEAAKPPDEVEVSEPSRNKPARKARGKGQAPVGDGDQGGAPSRFSLDASGLYYLPPGDEEAGRRRICDPLRVLALARDAQSNGWALWVEFETPDNETRRLVIPWAGLASDGAEWRRALLNAGFAVPVTADRRRWLTEYLIGKRPALRIRLADKTGWHGEAFVTQSKCIGLDRGEQVMFHSEAPIEDAMGVSGELAEWQDHIGRYCVGNSRMLLAVGVALAGPLLKFAGLESGGLNLYGNQGIGKTTFLRVAASVFGGPKFMKSARTTDNSLEIQAAQHSDMVLLLDEFAQLDPKIVGDVVYMLGNSSAKSRSTRTIQLRATLTWRLMFVFSAEVTLQQHMSEGGKKPRAGQETRLVDVPADAGAGHGLFDGLHGHDGGAALSRHLVQACAQYYGTLGEAFITWCSKSAGTLPARVRTLMDEFASEVIPEAAGGQVERVGRRFALIAAAGELATEAGLTGWPVGETARGVRDCFNAWLVARGGIGDAEERQMLQQVRRFLELHGESRFHWWHRAADDRSPNTPHRAGFRKLVSERGEGVNSDSDHMREFGERMHAKDGEYCLTEYYVLREVFRTEVCEGFDHVAVAKVLDKRGHLITEKAGRPDRAERLPGMGSTRCYRIKSSIFNDDGD